MKLFGINFGKQEQEQIPVINATPAKVEERIVNPYTAFDFQTQNEYMPPTSSYYEMNGFIKWGHNNLFPLQLADLYNSSPIHSAICLQKAKMIVGEGIRYNEAVLSGLTVQQRAELNRFDLYADGIEKSLEQIASELALDYQIFGAYAIEVTWNTDFSKIIKINRLPVMNIRLRVEDNFGKVNTFFYNKDWTRTAKFGTTQIPAFNVMDKTSQNQVMYVKNQSLDGRYYGTPSYASALHAIYTDAAILKFYNANVSNGMSPSLLIKFYEKPSTQEQRDEVISTIKREYQGQGNAGKCMVTFSDGKELAPDIAPITINNIDKVFTTISTQIVEQIVRAHRGVSGILFGVQSMVKVNSVNEYNDAFRIFERTVLTSDRKVLENTLNRILKINGLNVGLEFKPFDIFDTVAQTA